MPIKNIFRVFVCIFSISSGEAINHNKDSDLLNQIKGATSEYNRLSKKLSENGISIFDSESKLQINKKDRAVFRGLSPLLSADVVVNKIIFSQGREVILVLSIADLLENKIVVNDRLDYLGYELDLFKVKNQVDNVLGASKHKRVVSSYAYKQLVATSVALYSKVLFNLVLKPRFLLM